jgi:transcriptional regulator with XRE-family HTH domain
MPTPLHLKPPTAAWIVRERKRLNLKPADVARRLNEMGYPDVREATVKVWESNSNRRPGPSNLEGLERLFGSHAPEVAAIGADTAILVDALREQIRAISDLAAEIRLSRAEEAVTRQEMMRALAALAGGRALQETQVGGARGTPVGAER